VLPSRPLGKMQRRETELTALFTLVAAALVLVAATLSLLWLGRLG